MRYQPSICEKSEHQASWSSWTPAVFWQLPDICIRFSDTWVILKDATGYWHPCSEPEIECKDLSTTADATFEADPYMCKAEIRSMVFENRLKSG